MDTRILHYLRVGLLCAASILILHNGYGQTPAVPCDNPPSITLGTAEPVCPEEYWIILPYSVLQNFDPAGWNAEIAIAWDDAALAASNYWDYADGNFITIADLGACISIISPEAGPGTYTGTITLTNDAGCSSTPYPFSVTIDNPLSVPAVNIEVVNGKVVNGIIEICGEGSIKLTAIGDPDYEYRWYQNDYFIKTGQVFDYTFYTPMYDSETFTYEVSQSLPNRNCESARTAIPVTHSRIPYPGGFNSDKKICVGSTKQVEIWIQPDAGGTWGSSNTNVATVDQTGLVTGVGAGTANITYSLNGTGACASTTSSSSVPFQVYDNYALITGNNGQVCQGGTAEFYINAPAGNSLYYQINDGDENFHLTTGPGDVIQVENVQNNVMLKLTRVAYNIYCSKDLTGEPNTTSEVTVSSPPVVIINPATSDIYEGTSVELTASGADTYIWSPADGLSATTEPMVTATPSKTTTYNVTGTTADGCSSFAYATVYVRELCKNSADQYEPNNSMDNAGFVVPVGIKIAANLLNSKDADWYGLYADANAKYTLSLENPNGTNLPAVVLYNAAGRSLKSIDRANPNSYNLSTGWYYIKVSAKGLKSYLCYTLQVLNIGPAIGPLASALEDELKSAGIELTEDGNCFVWPNPAREEFSLFNGFKSPVRVRVSDMLGRTMETIENVGPEKTIVFGADYKPGIYIVETSGEDVRQVFKVIKQQ